ncbi:NFACT family protein [Oscillibacter sp. MSJ-2]|uniref:Rqc2 homolog RqcH n=1 Tax=Dysosmobacter acutus TaxID=2841504 RepID=A0ABS6FBQ3_9FIRM|nr:NFACT RNA binding domain-containing protein [Dysosmobacter acutus]MBU5627086.1 NFACT family protein [Dysosmobacter acutus]
MPLDALCLHAVVEELRPRIVGTRIDKVQQPARDQVILLLRKDRLLLNAGANAPRIHLTAQLRDNPAQPPMFCMLLRKHLTGGKLIALAQPGLERVVELTLEVTTELGEPGIRKLVLEAMGRRSNLVLLDGEGRIIDCMRRVDAEMSPLRQVLPGLYYRLPPAPEDKEPLTEATEESFQKAFGRANPEKTVDGWLLERFFGLSPLTTREISCRCGAERLFELGGDGAGRLWSEIEQLQNAVLENHFTPTAIKRDGKFVDFSYREILQYGTDVEQVWYGSFSELMDDFFADRERQDRVRQRGQDIIRTVTTARDRVARKIALQEKDYAATKDRDQLRICGDLITANLYRMEKGAASFSTENFYDEACGPITIPLDPLLTPQQNAAKYYKRYNKTKTAERYLTEQLTKGREELSYLESVMEEIGRAESEQDFMEIRSELRQAGYLRRQSGERREMKRPASRPREFRSSAGMRILVGRNNRQNDALTMKEADRRDLWFHTQKIHGSHVILCTQGQEPDRQSMMEAAMLAAWFSQASGGQNVPVDYTPVKFVKKPAGAQPGMVVYETYQTVYVTPEETLARKIEVRR